MRFQQIAIIKGQSYSFDEKVYESLCDYVGRYLFFNYNCASPEDRPQKLALGHSTRVILLTLVRGTVYLGLARGAAFQAIFTVTA